MRKSLPKTRPSELSSRVASLPAALLAAAAGRGHAAKANGDLARGPVAAISREERLATRLRLLEGFISRTGVADCAEYALQWLADLHEVPQSVCLVRGAGEPALYVAASHGVSSAGTAGLT